MVRIALVEDDAGYQATLQEYLQKYEKENSQIFRVTTFLDGDEIVENYRADFDIILMDIEMRFMDGMTAAERIREVDSEVIIIFITNTPQFAMKGYMVDALDYVLKPVSYYAFTQRINRAISRMNKRRARFISVPVKGGIIKLAVARIIYVEVQNHDLIFHTADGSYTTRGTMRDVEGMLEGSPFFRCNKCYLINLEYVEGIHNFDVRIGDAILQVSRSRRRALMDAMNEYINEAGK